MTKKNFWLSPEAKILFDAAKKIFYEKKSVTPAGIIALRKKFPQLDTELIRKSFALAEGETQAKKLGKFEEGKIFSRSIAEQMTAPEIAQHHAEKFSGRKNVLEICTGSGSDAIAIAKAVENISTIEADEFTADIAEHNFFAEGLKNISLLRRDAEKIIPQLDLGEFDAIWADPARRSNSGKIYSADDYLPPLSWIMSLAEEKLCGIKISPGINLDLQDGWTREWIGYRDECREQILWKNSDSCDGKVTLFDGKSDIQVVWQPQEIFSPSAILSDEVDFAGKFLLEPHAALIRSGYLSSFFGVRGIEILDEQIAYGISGTEPEKNSFYQTFLVEENFSFSMKLLQKKISGRNWSKQTEIKKRGFFLDSDEIRKKIKFPQSQDSGVIILTRRGEDHVCFLCRRV